MRNAFKRSANSKFILLICSVVLITLFIPSFIFGVRGGDDIVYHLSWFLSFKDIFGADSFYPRWLHDQMAGMGSPALFFYPPFTTFFFGFVDILTRHALLADHVLGLAAFFMAALSAITFFIWARIFSSTNVSLLAATFYAMAPYHLLMDFYTRAAFAEYAAYIWVPLIFAGIHKVLTTDEKKWPAILTMSISGLFMTHLLTAMIAGPIAAIYALVIGSKSEQLPTNFIVKRFSLLTLSTVLGVGMAAIYFVPAIQLLKQTNTPMLHVLPIDQSALFSHLFDTSKKHYKFYLKLSFFAAVYAALALYLALEIIARFRNALVASLDKGIALLWIGTIVLTMLFMAGQFGFLFKEPSPYREMQFLWRFLGIVEFAAISLFLIATKDIPNVPARGRIMKAFAVVFCIVFVYQCYDLVQKFKTQTLKRNEITEMDGITYRLSPSEYFPADTTFPQMRPDVLLRLKKYIDDDVPAYVIQGDGKIVHAIRAKSNFAITINGTGTSIVALHQFYFPGWDATDEKNNKLTVFPATSDKLAAFEIGAGSHVVQVKRSQTEPEHLGSTISLIAFLFFVLLTLANLFLKKSRSDPYTSGKA